MQDVDEAARLIRSGRLVAFPTETVYGLGANALDANAVERIYAAKGRPASSPLIVHVDSIEMARRVVSEWPERAAQLADLFWPGALTLVLPKNAIVPDNVTAGLPTVGVRVPSHPVALALIRAAGVPIAAPSANRFTELSPTTAEHVRQSLGEHVALVLDGGPTQLGIESTVLALNGDVAVLLRPGMISQTEIEDVIGPVQTVGDGRDGAHPSPGLHRKHYSPKTRLLLLSEHESMPGGNGMLLQMPEDPGAYAKMLYARLHDLDARHLDWIAIRRPPTSPEWAGILDRLERASN